MHNLLNLIKDKWYILFYMLVNIGFISSFTLKYHSIYLENFTIGLFLILCGFFAFDYLVNILRVFDRLYEKYSLDYNLHPFFNKFTKSNNFIVFCKITFMIMIIFLPLMIGNQIKYNPTYIQIFLNICMSFLFILSSINVIYYGYIKPNFQKRNITYFVLLALIVFNVLNFIYPHIFSFFLENFAENLMDIIVISLTFVLMTATLGLLAFTYNTVLKNKITKNKMKLIGVDYFKSTIFVIFFSFGLFLLFVILNIFKLYDWSVPLNGNYSVLVEINIVCIVIFISTYFMIRFLEYFIKATKNCLEEFKLI